MQPNKCNITTVFRQMLISGILQNWNVSYNSCRTCPQRPLAHVYIWGAVWALHLCIWREKYQPKLSVVCSKQWMKKGVENGFNNVANIPPKHSWRNGWFLLKSIISWSGCFGSVFNRAPAQHSAALGTVLPTGIDTNLYLAINHKN